MSCVLVVDDDLKMLEAITAYLDLEGHKVFRASGGKLALEIYNAHPEIKFVLSDIRMPEGSGIWLLKELKAIKTAGPSVCLMTGFAEVTKEAVLNMGAIDLLSKPIDVEQVIELINKYA